MNNENLNQLNKALYYFGKKTPDYNQIIFLNNNIEILKKEINYSKKNSMSKFSILLILFLVVSPSLFVINPQFYLQHDYNFQFILFIIIMDFVIISFIFAIINYSKNSKIGKLNYKYEHLLDSLYQYYNSFEYSELLPFKYTFPTFITILITYIEDYRATTITDAINLYYDEIHKQNMEYSQNEIKNMAKSNNKSIKRASNWATAATAISVLGLFVKQ
jgi:hypothetical protein